MSLLPRPLDAPLPTGMRDRLPHEAEARRALIDRVLRDARGWGYVLIDPPSFEFASVLERGLPGAEAGDVLRFVEPESGEIAALRPDVTPQIARILATRMRHAPPPIRLMYVAGVVRRAGVAWGAHREVAQFGVELAGPSGPLGDLELVALADSLLAGEHPTGLTLDLGDAQILEGLLGSVGLPERMTLQTALHRRDRRAIGELAPVLPDGVASVLDALLDLPEAPEAFAAARTLLAPWADAVRALCRLEMLVGLVRRAELRATLRVDLATVRGFSYYTGATFQFFAAGAADALVSGGRYDTLVSRYGRELCSSGFAVDLERLSQASTKAAAAFPLRVIVVGAEAFVAARDLRRAGLVAIHGEGATDPDADFILDEDSFTRRTTGMRIFAENPAQALLAHLRSAAVEAAYG